MVGTFTAAAEERPPPAIACGGAIIARGTATRVLDGRGFVLADGREVRLAGIEVPPLPLPDRPYPAAGGGEAARQALAAKFAGSEIVLRQAEAQPTDRYGRLVGYGFRFCPSRDPGRRPRLCHGAIKPGKRRSPRQAWPLGRSVL
jgi:endonuclease YncB( thermonuclease family)